MTRQEISQAVGNISTRHIQEAEAYFEESRLLHLPFRKIAVIAAIITCFIALSAFSLSIFSTWRGDRLTVSATYGGSGIVWLKVTNHSGVDLTLDPALNIYRYSTQQPVPTSGGALNFSTRTIPANSTQKIRLDLRQAYDIEILENTVNDFYYLEITNSDFLTGQTWTCMISFRVGAYCTPYYPLSDTDVLNGVLPGLNPYFSDFTPDIFARWADAFTYTQLVDAALAQTDCRIVAPTTPYLICYQQGWKTSSATSMFDTYNKLIGRNDMEKSYQIGCSVPTMSDEGELQGSWGLSLFYFYTYDKSKIQSPEDCAFIRGNLLTFAEMEPYKVYEEDRYVVYEMHEFFYSDLRTYVNDMLLQRDDIYFDEQVWQRIQNYYNYWNDRQRLGAHFANLEVNDPRPRKLLTIDVVAQLGELGSALSFEDLKDYSGTYYEISYRYGAGISYVIDDDYEFFRSMNADWTHNAWYLIHTSSGDRLELGVDGVDVDAFVAAHDAPEPRCTCTEEDQWSHHGWQLTLDWLMENGSSMQYSDLSRACMTIHDTEERFHVTYRVDENFFVGNCWHEELHQWVKVLVHIPTGDELLLPSADIQNFILAHVQ